MRVGHVCVGVKKFELASPTSYQNRTPKMTRQIGIQVLDMIGDYNTIFVTWCSSNCSIGFLLRKFDFCYFRVGGLRNSTSDFAWSQV